MRKIMSLLAVLCCEGLFAVDVECSWTVQCPQSLADGAVQFTYDGEGNVSSITVTPIDGGDVVLSGEAIPLASDAVIKLAAPGRFVVENALNGSGLLTVTNSILDHVIEYDGARLDTEEWTSMFKDRSLADYVPLKSIRGSGNGEYDTGVYSPYGVKRFEEDGYSQMSVTLIKVNATLSESKIVLMRLRQNGSDIEGIIDRACFHSKRCIYGEDIEKLAERNTIFSDPDFTADFQVHTPKSAGGYGVNNFFMQMDCEASVELRGKASSGLRYNIHGVALKVASTAVDGALAGSVAGCGGLGLTSVPKVDESDPCTEAYEDFITRTTVTVAQNRMLTSLTNVTAEISGRFVQGKLFPAKLYQIRGNNLCITGEVQVASDQSTWRFVTLEIKQVGFDIKATAIDSGWVKNGTMNITGYVGNHSIYEAEFDSWRTDGQEPSSTANANPVGACNFRFMYSEPASVKMDVDSSFTNLMASGASSGQPLSAEAVLRIGGSAASPVMAVVPWGASTVFPTNGIVEVCEGGDLVFSGGCVAGNTSLIRVLHGGRLRVRRASAIEPTQNVHLDGGELIMRDDQVTTLENSWCYLERIMLRDGARVKGAPCQIGNVAASALWWVSGSKPSMCEASALFCNKDTTIEFKVHDVTDSEAPDFLYKGDFNARDGNSKNITFVKTGGGALSHSGAFGNLRKIDNPVRIDGGVWLMDGSASQNQEYCMNGGDFAASAGTENIAGALTVSQSGTLKVGVGGKLSIADSSAKIWAEGVRITVDADLANGAVRFGTTDAGLTKAQLSKMRYCSRRVYLDSNGYLRDAGVFGTVISFR